MSDDEWNDLLDFRPPEYLRKLGPDDLPRIVREAFTEVDGQRGRLIGIDSLAGSYEGWNGRDSSSALPSRSPSRRWVGAGSQQVPSRCSVAWSRQSIATVPRSPRSLCSA